MHEYPITVEIIKIASRHCKEADGEKVKKINLVIGDYSGYLGDSIKMYFDIIAEGTPCEGAEVEILRVKAKLRCPQCGEIFDKPMLSFACPVCGTDGEQSEIGKEFYVDTIEVE